MFDPDKQIGMITRSYYVMELCDFMDLEKIFPIIAELALP